MANLTSYYEAGNRSLVSRILVGALEGTWQRRAMQICAAVMCAYWANKVLYVYHIHTLMKPYVVSEETYEGEIHV